MSTEVIVDHHRQRLVDELAGNQRLRSQYARASAADPDVLDLEAGEFEDYLVANSDSKRVIATALCHPDEDVVALAALYVTGERPIPEPTPSIGESVPVDARHDTQHDQGEREEEADDSAVVVGEDEGDDAAGAAIAEFEATVAELEATVAEREQQLQAETVIRRDAERRLKAANAQIERQRVPRLTKGQRRSLGTAQRVERERDQLNDKVAELESQLNEVRAELAAAVTGQEELEATSQDLRRRLARNQERQSTIWRAEYLRRLLPAAREEARAAAASLSDGPQKTAANRKVAALDDLLRLLDAEFPSPHVEGVAAPVASPPATTALTVGRDRTLRVTPLGGDNHIGGSALLVEAGQTRFLIDAGLRMGPHPAPRDIEIALEGRLDAVIVTHAHNDHAGYVPVIVERHRRIQVVGSPGTVALLPTMWNDSAHVMERTAEDRRQYLEGYRAPYGHAEVEQAEERLTELSPGHTLRIADVEISLFDAGHVLGACGVDIRAGDQHLVVTGDIADFIQGSVDGANLPGGLRGADLLVCESTYCQGNHNERGQEVDSLVKAVTEIIDGFGRVLIPAFGLGRAQEITLILRDRLPDVPVLVDGLARDISHIYERLNERTGHDLKIFGGRVQEVTNATRRRLIEEFTGGVIVTTSGMLTGGFAIPWAMSVLPDDKSALFLCGYQDEEAPGRQLLELGTASGASRRLDLQGFDGSPESVLVKARVERYNLSAHADRHGLTEIIRTVEPSELMLVHGYPEHQRGFRAWLGRQYEIASVDNNAAWSAR